MAQKTEIMILDRRITEVEEQVIALQEIVKHDIRALEHSIQSQLSSASSPSGPTQHQSAIPTAMFTHPTLNMMKDSHCRNASIEANLANCSGDVDTDPTFELPKSLQGAYNDRLRSRKLSNPVVGDSRLAESVVRSVNDQTNEAEDPQWRPYAVMQMPTIDVKIDSHPETFTWQFIKQLLNGEEYSPGYFFNAPKIKSKAYWVLEAENEPFIPSSPGLHGAKVTAFFNQSECSKGRSPKPKNFLNTPLFVRLAGQTEYTYFGVYSQLRFSDRISYDDLMTYIPKSLIAHHASILAEAGRPSWVTEALKEHFWPKPTYDGPIPPVSATAAESHSSDIQAFFAELRAWSADADMRVARLTAATLKDAFGRADADAEPGLRLWWEYLQCVGYDAGFYDMLVRAKADPSLAGNIAAMGVSEQIKAAEAAEKKKLNKRGVPATVVCEAKEDHHKKSFNVVDEPSSAPLTSKIKIEAPESTFTQDLHEKSTVKEAEVSFESAKDADSAGQTNGLDHTSAPPKQDPKSKNENSNMGKSLMQSIHSAPVSDTPPRGDEQPDGKGEKTQATKIAPHKRATPASAKPIQTQIEAGLKMAGRLNHETKADAKTVNGPKRGRKIERSE